MLGQEENLFQLFFLLHWGFDKLLVKFRIIIIKVFRIQSGFDIFKSFAKPLEMHDFPFPKEF